MLVTTGLVALSAKVRDDKARRKTTREASKSIPSSLNSEMKSKPLAIEAGSPSTHSDETPDVYSPSIYSQCSGQQATVVDSKDGATLLSPTEQHDPPAYSSQAALSLTSTPGERSNQTGSSDRSTRTASISESSNSTISDSHAIRVRTKGDDLKTGFPYHPGLFDVNVRPDEWEKFSNQITDAAKFTSGDYIKMYAAAGGLALTGSIMTSAWVGRTINRNIQEKKVSTGLEDTSEGSLGDTIQKWNESYFARLGLCAHLTLSESALRQPNQKSKILRKPSLLYGTREERERKREDRKFVIVISRLEPLSPTEGVAHELETENARAELPATEDPRTDKAELPGDEVHKPQELPTPRDQAKEDKADVGE
ncbi:hypothetical protein Q7P37_004543 [Cladosporium fusiforme]